MSCYLQPKLSGLQEILVIVSITFRDIIRRNIETRYKLLELVEHVFLSVINKYNRTNL